VLNKLMFMLLFCFGNVTLPDKDIYVDMLEYNHVYNKQGDHCFSQVILWVEFPIEGISTEYRALDWIMVNNYREKIVVEPRQHGKLYSTKKRITFKGKDFYVNVHAPLFRESWTVDDPERISSNKHYPIGKDGLKPLLFKMTFDPEIKAARESIDETKDD